MKKTIVMTLAACLFAGVAAEAKKEMADKENGKPEKEMKQTRETAEIQKQAAEDKAEEAMKKAKSEKAMKKGKAEEAKNKGRSEEMKEATAEKKEEQLAAKESGEKMDKKKKSKWKFWQKD